MKCIEGYAECGKDICCFVCDNYEECTLGKCDAFDDKDDFTINGCESIINEIVPFETKHAALLKHIAEIETGLKSLESERTAMKVKLLNAMEEYGITNFDNEYFKAVYKKASTRTTIDTAKLKKDLPDIAEKYSKVSKVSSSVTITVK